MSTETEPVNSRTRLVSASTLTTTYTSATNITATSKNSIPTAIFSRFGTVKGNGDGQIYQGCGFGDVDPEGNVYVGDLHRLQKFGPDGTYLLTLGATPGPGKLGAPSGVAIDAQGNVFVGEWERGQIKVFAPDGTFLAKWGEFGPGEGQLNSGDAVALDGASNVYVADNKAGRIVKFRLLPPLGPEATPTT